MIVGMVLCIQRTRSGGLRSTFCITLGGIDLPVPVFVPELRWGGTKKKEEPMGHSRSQGVGGDRLL